MPENQEAPSKKANRIAVAATVAGVLLFLFLAIFLTIQFVQIGVKRAKAAELQKQIDYYENVIENGEKDLEYYETYFGMYFTAMEQGWRN